VAPAASRPPARKNPGTAKKGPGPLYTRDVFPARVVALILATLLPCLQACSSDEPVDDGSPDASADAAVPDPSETLFAPDHLIEVEIEMDPADWDLIRNEGREMVEVFSWCPGPFEYTYVEATITVDGETFDRVAVRKKGFLGSLSPPTVILDAWESVS